MRKSSCLAIVFLFLAFYCALAQSPRVLIQPKKGWIQKFTAKYEALPDTGQQSGYYYLLLDKQQHVRLEEIHHHYAYKLLTAEGVQQMSDITVSFDPKHETLIFHEVLIHRDGQAINKMPAQIKTIQHEESMDRFLYDESFTAIINVTDVRVGDVVEYAYTVKGSNPVFSGKVMQEFYADMRFPFEKKLFRMVVPTSVPIEIRNVNTVIEPSIEHLTNESHYLWVKERSNGLISDSNAPDWYNPFQRVVISSFKSWQEVSEWGTQLYKVSDSEKQLLWREADKVIGESQGEEFIMKAIHFVQDEIRYLGFESGLNGYKPHSPLKVWNQRFGDCKDKSLLLCTILQSRGIEAYPVLVNTVDRDKLTDGLPSAVAFDHCVAQFRFDDKIYNIDPTVSNQGGSLNAYWFPDYRVGLPLNNSTGLTEISTTGAGYQKETQIFKLDSIGGGADMEVKTVYEGRMADHQRSYLSNTRRDAVQKSYKDYYADQYPDLVMTADLIVQDDRAQNKLTTIEKYRIKKFWESDDVAAGSIYCKVRAVPLESYFNVSGSLDRTSPYGLTFPLDKRFEIQIHTPTEWSIESEKDRIETDYYQYDYESSYRDSVVTVSTAYTTKTDAVPVDALEKFLADHNKMYGNLSFHLTWTPSQPVTDAPKWPGFVMLSIILVGAAYLAFHGYKAYDPQPFYPSAWGMPIGGWLVLPAIGVILSPLRLAVDFFKSPEFLNGENWVINYVNGHPLLSALGVTEQIYNVSLAVFSVLMVILFFQRRSSVPKLMIYYYAVPAVWTVVDPILVELIAPGQNSGDPTLSIFQAVIGAAIWIPYFSLSHRVKRTFVNTYNRGNGPEVVMAPEVHSVEASS
jgi:transglutaminase-like putative cysteine protease